MFAVPVWETTVGGIDIQRLGGPATDRAPVLERPALGPDVSHSLLVTAGKDIRRWRTVVTFFERRIRTGQFGLGG